MRNFFCIQPIKGVRQLPFLEEPRREDNRLFQHIPLSDFVDICNITPTVSQAEAVLLPHMLTDLRKYPDYVPAAIAFARTEGKRLIVFTNQDDPTPLGLPESCIIFRPSTYRSTLSSNEVIMPAQIEDVGARAGHRPLDKGELPHVGFIGKAAFDSLNEALRYLVKNYVLHHGPDREGMYYRRKALALLAADKRIILNANRRRRFSANVKTVELPPDQARQEYIRNIAESLFTLAPRGAGNYSLRFYETLSLGRLPILIDTDMRLPLEEVISYDSFIVRVPWQELSRLPDILIERFAHLSDEEAYSMQLQARKTFEEYLYLPAFLRTTFEKLDVSPI